MFSVPPSALKGENHAAIACPDVARPWHPHYPCPGRTASVHAQGREATVHGGFSRPTCCASADASVRRTVLVDNGHETEWRFSPARLPHYRAADLAEAATLITRGAEHRGTVTRT